MQFVFQIKHKASDLRTEFPGPTDQLSKAISDSDRSLTLLEQRHFGVLEQRLGPRVVVQDGRVLALK